MLLGGPFLFPILFPLAWVAFIPLFCLVRAGGTLRRAFFLGWLAGGVTSLLGFYWLSYTIRVFGGFSYGLSGFIFLVFAAYAALPFALHSLLVRRFGLGPLCLFPAIFWVVIEFWFPHLFPWHLANSQSEFLPLIQSADLVGPYGTSFLLAWLNTTLYALVFSPGGRGRVRLREMGVLSLVLLGALVYGYLRLSGVEADMRSARSLTVAAIQGSIDIQHKWSAAHLESNLKSYQDLTRKIQDVDLVLWPETAVELWVPENIARVPPELIPALDRDTTLIFGARSFRGNPAVPNLKAFNSAFLVDSQGRALSYYHKQVLLAFGEYIPFGSVLSKLPGIPPLGDGFTPGDGPRTLALPSGIKVAPLICYEDLMPDLARRFVAEKGANLLVNLTNDAWFGDTVAPWQHARLARWRAIETRRTLVRVTNTGLTTVINARGEMVQNLPVFSSGALTATVEILEGETPYVRFGDWFAWGITLLSLGIVFLRHRTLSSHFSFFLHPGPSRSLPSAGKSLQKKFPITPWL